MINRHPEQIKLVALLKTKGTGETMGKHLSPEDLQTLTLLLVSEHTELTTKATMWTALTMLTQTADEAAWFHAFPKTQLPQGLHFFWEPQTAFQRCCNTVVSGQSLTRSEAKSAIQDVLDPSIPAHEKAVFLEALRLKRETLDENLGVFEGLWETCLHTKARVPRLIDLSLSYDGFSRTPLLAPFCAPILASLGYPTIVHGTDNLGPKYGQTTHRLLRAAGKKMQQTTAVITDLETPSIGWGYIDQSESAPALHALTTVRNDMVKRPLLATLDKLMQPIHGDTTFLVTGYTHPPYRPLLLALCDKALPVTGAVVMRGVEGSIQPPIDRRFPVSMWTPQTTEEVFFRAADLGLAEAPLPTVSLADKDVVNFGVDALCGKPGFAYDTLLLMGTTILTGLKLMAQDEALIAVEKSLREGLALAHWTRKK
jgi:anthranilate phosphoribosyltransferase